MGVAPNQSYMVGLPSLIWLVVWLMALPYYGRAIKVYHIRPTLKHIL